MSQEILPNGIALPAAWPPRIDPDAAMPVPYLEDRPAVIPIDLGRQLFVDDFLIESTTLVRRFHQPEKHSGNPLLRPETELERQHGLCPAAGPFGDGVVYDPQDRLFKMWYQAGWFDGTALATSRDGLDWERPNLDVVPGTNRVIPNLNAMRRDGVTVWLDHEATKPDERFKMLLFTRYGEIGGALRAGDMHILTSPDGIHWNFRAQLGQSEDNNSFFYNPFRRKWVFSSRGVKGGLRVRYYSECDDFVQAPKREAWQRVFWAGPDRADEPDPSIGEPVQVYKVDAVAYEGLMLGLFQMHYGPPNQLAASRGIPKTTHLQVAFSRDGFHWQRPVRRPFITAARQAGTWDREYLTCAGGCCVIVGDKLHFYYSGFAGDETNTTNGEHWSGLYANCSTGVAVLRRDGFASMQAGDEPGTLTTRPVRFSGNYLFVNLDAPAGELRVEVLDEVGEVIAPFSATNCIPASGDATKLAVRWQGEASLAAVGRRPVRLRFHLANGRFYAFWVSSTESGASGGYLAAGSVGHPGIRDQ